MRGSEKATLFDAGLIVAFVVGNVICFTLEVKDVATLVKRSGVICTINLVPLALGEHMNMVASWCGLSLGAYARIHEWLGIVVIVEGLVHTAAGAASQKLDLHTTSGIATLAAGAVIGALLLSSVASVRRHLYEIFQKLHLVLAAMLIAVIYLHSPSKKLLASPTVYLLAAICVHIFTASLRLWQILYRNVRHRAPLSRVTVQTITYKTSLRDTPLSDAVHVHIRPSKPWKPQAGQYVYLCIPGASHTSFVQSHPFFVAWWYRDAEGDVIVLIVEKRKGFTRDLFHHASNDVDLRSGMRAIVEGPYGKELDLESYDTVLLFATGMGIAGQLPYVTQLLERYQSSGVTNRRIALFWELDSEIHAAWVADMMMELLRRDTNQILHIQLFVLGNYLDSTTEPGTTKSLGTRIQATYAEMNAEGLIEFEIEGQRGSAVISLCANDETCDNVRGAVQRMHDRTVHVKELEYRPYSPRGHKGLLRRMVQRKMGKEVGDV